MSLSTIAPLSARDFDRIRRLAHQYSGLRLEAGKEGLVYSRLSKIMRQKGMTSFDRYFSFVVGDKSSDALIEMIDHLTTNHTAFYREPQHFNFLQTSILPRLADRPLVRIWSAACSTGQEPYTIAFAAEQTFGGRGPKVQVLASDISEKALAKARAGIYGREQTAAVVPALLRMFMLKGIGPAVGKYRVKPAIREMVRFERMNLIETFPSDLGSFSVIFCRNVMIYFDHFTQERLIERLTQHLDPGGYLLIGHAESLSGIKHSLKNVSSATYQKPGDLAGDRRRGA